MFTISTRSDQNVWSIIKYLLYYTYEYSLSRIPFKVLSFCTHTLVPPLLSLLETRLKVFFRKKLMRFIAPDEVVFHWELCVSHDSSPVTIVDKNEESVTHRSNNFFYHFLGTYFFLEIFRIT